MSTCLWEPTPLPLTLYLPELGQMAVSNHISQAGKWILAIQSRGSRFKENLGGLFQSYQKALKRGSVIFSLQSVPSSVIFSSANGICFHPISQTRSLEPCFLRDTKLYQSTGPLVFSIINKHVLSINHFARHSAMYFAEIFQHNGEKDTISALTKLTVYCEKQNLLSVNDKAIGIYSKRKIQSFSFLSFGKRSFQNVIRAYHSPV